MKVLTSMTTSKNNLNVFSGTDAIRNFLNPDCNPPLPLIEIPKELNLFFDDGVHIYAKCMNFLPLGNVKSLPAYNMLLEESENGGLNGVKNLIENSSGNTVFSLAVIGRLFGIPKTKAIVSHEVTWGKLQLLRLFGTEIFVNEEPICPDPNDKNSGIYLAKQIAKKKGWFNPGQYDNPANPEAHMKWTGPQIWEQTEGKISIFCAGLGTTGTILGTSKYLKEQLKDIVTIGVARKPNNPVPGVRTPNLLKEIAFDWKNYVDYIKEIGTKESFELSLSLCRVGLMVGPSAGFALVGLLDFIKEQKKLGQLDKFKNKDGEILAVFICPDSPLPYLEEYFEYLDDSYFPKIENENLLINKLDIKEKKKEFITNNLHEIKAEDAYRLLYPISKKELWKRVSEEREITLNKNMLIVDVRTNQEFQHFHLPGSWHIELQKLTKQLPKLQKEAKGKKVVFVCKTGNRSGVATQLARNRNIDALNLIGGVTEWSRLNLPRIRPEVCVGNHLV
jgi:cysteine synthase/rhodanese-related sulfurtransferase